MRILTQFEGKPLLFQNPLAIISCVDLAAFYSCFQEMEKALKQGYYLAGFVSYEAGYCFEDVLRQARKYDFPLVYMGVYKTPLRRTIPLNKAGAKGALRKARFNVSKEKYFADINTIRGYIARGEVYQVTYCLKLLFEITGGPLPLYVSLLRKQPVPYPAYIESDKFQILSLSPEMFIKKHGRRLATKPMKGTWMRGSNIISDLVGRIRFNCDEKNRAENLMIADLLRNDLGRVGTGIRAPRLFEVAKYATLFQMTSTVTGSVDKDIPLYELFAAIFPSGSVTGAPKISAMKIIEELEQEPRHIYTGAIGYISPDKDMFFNVPIRTLLIRDGRGEMGIGGGIVWDSTPQGEWDEGVLKAKFVADCTN